MWRDVCCVFRIACTHAESGKSSLPISPITKSLSYLVHAEARQPDIVRQTRVAEPVPDLAVLAQDDHLFFLRQSVELALAPEWIPDVPLPFSVRHHLARAMQQPILQIRFVTQRIRAAHHRVVRLESETMKRAVPQKRPQRVDEEVRALAPRQQPDTARVVGVFIEDALQPGVFQRAGEILRIVGVSPGQKLHVETAVGRLLRAAPHSAFFSEIQWFHLCFTAHKGCPSGTLCASCTAYLTAVN